VMSRYATLVAYWVTDVGRLHQVIHVWAYNDAGHRAAQRARLYADPEWTEGYLPRALDYVQTQECVC
jgi:hypothetical protein